MADKPFIETYYDSMVDKIDEKGVELPWGITQAADGGVSIYALAVPPTQAYQVMLAAWVRDRPVEMAFALDRFAKPDQGTTLGDLLAGFHFIGEKRVPFIIEYQHEPRIVKPIDYNNTFWNGVLMRELIQTVRAGVPR